MRRQRQRDTGPELIVRRILRELGRGYRLHRRDLPGSPDISNAASRWAIFVHGCYWHQHPGCSRATIPSANRDWWVAKFARNQERDQRKIEALEAERYRVLVVWECETRDVPRLRERLSAELLGDREA